MSWKLKRLKQCEKCPWRVDVDPYDIPNGYSLEQHKALESSIAKDTSFGTGSIQIMACHEMHDAHCIGWLVNQLGDGNNIPMRIAMMGCLNGAGIKTVGEQHETFEDTLP